MKTVGKLTVRGTALLVIANMYLLITLPKPVESTTQGTNVRRILASEIESGRTPSVQYYFFDRDSIIDSYSGGYADLDSGKPVSIHTTYNAFSVTKTFTALAVMQLVERRLVGLDSPVIEYVPDFPYDPDITVRQLLSHTAGLPNPIPLAWIHAEEDHATFDEKEFFRSVVKKNRRMKYHPEATFSYSNLGYVFLGQLVERVSGMSYEEYVEKNIIRKLPVSSDRLGFTIRSAEVHARGYIERMSFTNLALGLFIEKSKFMDRSKGKWKPFKPFYVNGSSYGGLIGTPLAFVRYLQEMLKPESELLGEVSRNRMFEEQTTYDGERTGMCLSWFTGNLLGQRYLAHAGGGGGYYCEIRLYPELGKGSVIFFNRTGIADERFLDKVDVCYLKEQVMIPEMTNA